MEIQFYLFYQLLLVNNMEIQFLTFPLALTSGLVKELTPGFSPELIHLFDYLSGLKSKENSSVSLQL
jgi:hypothetical protein